MAWLISVVTTGWCALAARLPAVAGVRHRAIRTPSLPAGFEGERLEFELLVLTPIALVVLAGCACYALARPGPDMRRRLSRSDVGQ